MSSLVWLLNFLVLLNFAVGEFKIELTDQDRVHIEKLAAHGSGMMITMMLGPESLMLDVVKAVVEYNKADPEFIDFLKRRLERYSPDKDYDYKDDYGDDDDKDKDKKPKPEYLEYLGDMYQIYTDPALQDRRDRLNFWTNGLFDLKMGYYLQAAEDQEKGYVAAVHATWAKLSDKARNSIWKEVETMNRTTDMKEKLGIAMSIFDKLTPTKFYYR